MTDNTTFDADRVQELIDEYETTDSLEKRVDIEKEILQETVGDQPGENYAITSNELTVLHQAIPDDDLHAKMIARRVIFRDKM